MTIWGKFGALWRLARPGNVSLIVVAVFVGSVLAIPPGACPLAGIGGLFWTILPAALALGLVAAGGYALNDRCDLVIDRVNRPGRPLPAGELSPGSATLFAVLCWAGAIGLAWLGPTSGLWIVGFCIVLSLVYALWLKPTGLPGNLAVALMTSLALAYGALGAGNLPAVLPIAALAFLVNLARELYKDVEDLPGDREAGARTLAVRLGARLTRLIASAVAFAVTPALIGFHLVGDIGLLDALALGAGLALPLLVIGVYGLGRPGAAGRVQRWLKEAMLYGLSALLLGRAVYRLWTAGLLG